MIRQFLIIDDDETFSRVLARSMTRKGHLAYSVNDGEAALAFLREQTCVGAITHVILDLKLAEATGLHLLPRLLAINPRLQVVVLTGYASVATTVEAMKKGASNYLTKPATLEEIIAAFDSNPGDAGLAGGAVEGIEGDGIQDSPLSVQRVEWEYIQRQLVANDHNIAATARALGMHRRTLQRKLQKRPGKF